MTADHLPGGTTGASDEGQQSGRWAAGLRHRLREHWPLLLLVSIALVVHLALIDYYPWRVFDEGHYVPQAVSIVQDRGPQVVEADPTFLYHPSLAKLFMAAGIKLLGDNPWGWRIPSVLFGLAAIIVFYFICRKLAGNGAAVAGAFLLTFENFTFAYSGLAMLDVFSVTFMLASFLFFLDRRYVVSGMALGLAGLCKLPGLFGILVILGYWLIIDKRSGAARIGMLLAALAITFLLVMPLADFLATNQWFNPVDRIHDMVLQARSLKYSNYTPEEVANLGISYPWQWILVPVMLWTGGDRAVSLSLNPLLFVLIVPSMLYMVYLLLGKARNVAVFVLLWFGATYLVWIPVELVTKRAMYNFYLLPAVGAVCLAVGFGLRNAWSRSGNIKDREFRWSARLAVLTYVALYVVAFFVSPAVYVRQ